MTLGLKHLRTVAFIGSVGEDGARRLRGTGFFVGVAIPGNDAQVHLYLVTASHVVPPYEATFVRIRRFVEAPPDVVLDEGLIDELVDDVPVTQWYRHPSHDIAAAPMVDADDRWAISLVPMQEFVDDSDHVPSLGEPVFFAGLLAQVESMGEKHVPMLRSGTLGALHQTDIPMMEPGGGRRRLDGHLVDCRSFGGFSGSPCFVQMVRPGPPTPRMGLSTTEQHTLLLGMVGGHFDHQATVDVEGNTFSVPTSAGVAVVYPSELIRELLDDGEVVEAREREESAPTP